MKTLKNKCDIPNCNKIAPMNDIFCSDHRDKKPKKPMKKNEDFITLAENKLDIFRNQPFKSSLDSFIQSGKLSGSFAIALSDLFEEYASQSSSLPTDDTHDFLKYVTQAKLAFVSIYQAIRPRLSVIEITKVENLFVCFDQMKERIESSKVSNPVGK